MGKIFGGSKKSTQKQETKEESKNTNLLTQNQQYVNLFNQGVAEGSNAPIVPFELAGMDEAYQNALGQYSKGVDYSGLTGAYNKLTGAGQNLVQGAESQLGGYTDIINRIGGMSQADYQSMLQSEFNSSLVKEQIAGLTSDVQEQEAHSVAALNQQATASGNMGSSRAGVAQGVIAGQAARAIAVGSTQYRTAEEQQATNRLNTFLGNQMNVAQIGAGIAQGQQALGYNLYNQGMNYYSQGLGYQTQNNAAALQAGEMRRTYAQQQIDINRQNQLLNNTPSLTRLGLINATLAPVANFQTQGNSTGTTNTTTTTPDQGMSKMFGMIGTVGGSMFGPMGSMIGGMAGTALGNALQK